MNLEQLLRNNIGEGSIHWDTENSTDNQYDTDVDHNDELFTETLLTSSSVYPNNAQ